MMDRRLLVKILLLICFFKTGFASQLQTYFDWSEPVTLDTEMIDFDKALPCGDSIVILRRSTAWLVNEAEEGITTHKLGGSDLLGELISVGPSLLSLTGNGIVSLYNLTPEKDAFIKTSLPQLPEGFAFADAVETDGRLYIISGGASNELYSIDPADAKQWQKLQTLPASLGSDFVAAANNHGTGHFLYVFANEGSGAAFKYSISENKWLMAASVPETFGRFSTNNTTIGQSHIAFFPADAACEIYAYHTITDNWVKLSTDIASNVLCVVRKDTDITALTEDSQGRFTIESAQMAQARSFGILDYGVMGIYLIALAWMGVYFSKREKSADDFFLAGRRVPWWAAALSLVGTGLSALTFMTWPGVAYMSNCVMFMQCLMTPVAAVILIYFFVPFFRQLNVTTAYEYLEYRFNLPVRLLSSFMFMFMQIGRIGVVMFIPSMALATVTGFNVYYCILIMSVLCIFYTVLGGIEAVVWTDVSQVIILMGAAVVSLIMVICKVDGGLGGVIEAGMQADKFTVANMTWDWTIPALWVVIVGQFFFIFAIPTDQAMIQRLLVTKDEAQTRKSLWGWGFIGIPSGVLFYGLGVALFAYYKEYPQQVNPFLQNDAILPWFVATKLPTGVVGLVIAALFAATMSSVDSGMNSISAAVINDFYCRLKTNTTQKKTLLLARIVTLLVGLLGMSVALIMAAYGDKIKSILELYWEANVLIVGAVAGIFVLAVFTKSTNGIGAFIGALIGGAVLFLVKTQTEIHFLLYAAVGVIATVIGGLITSLIVPGKKDITGLTIYTLKKNK